MACRQRHELLAPAVKNGSAPTTSAPACSWTRVGEGGVDLAFGAGLQDIELHPLRARRFLHVSDNARR